MFFFDPKLTDGKVMGFITQYEMDKARSVVKRNTADPKVGFFWSKYMHGPDMKKIGDYDVNISLNDLDETFEMKYRAGLL